MADNVKRICIISRAQIRYEGDFVSVEYHESCGRTITLANVKSFGTENRPADKKALPKDVIYDKIMFTENDLVSITFVEDNDIIDDPSIVVAQPGSNSNIAPIGTKPTSKSAREPNSNWNDSGDLKFEEKHPTAPTSQRVNAWAANNNPHADKTTTSTSNGWMNNSPNHHQQHQSTDNNRYNQRENNRNVDVKSNPRNMRPNNNNYNNNRYNNNGSSSNYQNSNNRMFNRGGGRAGGTSGRGGVHQNNNKPRNYTRKEDDISFTGEYDIESANKELAAELEKLEVNDSGAEGAGSVKGVGSQDENDNPEKEDKIVYDSTKSIFDQLSSQMLDKAMGKRTVNQSFREERKLNSTTFGNLSVYNDSRNRNYRGYNHNNQGGGNYRGNYRGRGRHNQSGNNRYNPNNNNNRAGVVNEGENL